MVRLDIISDPICPWCYIGKANLDRAIADTGSNPFEIEWRIFQLNPDMPPEGRDRREYLETKFGGPELAQEIYGRIGDAAAQAGLDVHLDRIERTPNTMDAHRLIRWARQSGKQTELVEQLFHRYFENGEDISDHKVLLDACAAVGMEREVIAKLLEGDADRERLAEEDISARKMGVTGVPCFIIDGRHVVQGAQPPETWARIIRDITAEIEAKAAAAT